MAERLILVVDDEEPQRRVLAGFLRKAGYEVEAVGAADEALAVVASRTVDLVLTDLRMPGKTGVELLDAVRGVNPEVPVVVMTAYGTVASAVDAMKRGAADYLAQARGPRRARGPGDAHARAAGTRLREPGAAASRWSLATGSPASRPATRGCRRRSTWPPARRRAGRPS